MPNDFWSDADIIDIYTRRQAIDDGVLVQLSGPGYQGDPWIPAMVAEAGFRYPVAMTATAFCSYVSPLEGDGEELAPCQDIKGRLWDVLWMLKAAIRRVQAHSPFFTSACEWCPMSRRTTRSPTRQGPSSCISRPCAGRTTTARPA